MAVLVLETTKPSEEEPGGMITDIEIKAAK